MPGVVLLDRALLFAETLLGRPATAWQIGQAKFFNPVGPGEALEFRFQDTAGASIVFSIRAGEREVAAGSLKPVP
jgi:3-hydroxymyristoyl/3-hydroxydecanoyl-(acyl carrier protein) dehydratase